MVVIKDIWTVYVQAHKKLFEKGGADFELGQYTVILFLFEKLRKSWKSWWGGDSDHFFPFLTILGQFSRHGVGVSSYITNLYNKQANNKKRFFTSKGGGGVRSGLLCGKISSILLIEVCLCLMVRWLHTILGIKAKHSFGK